MNKKKIFEAYNDARAEMKGIIDKAETENRNLTDEESKQFDELAKKATDYMNTYQKMNEMDDFKDIDAPKDAPKMSAEEKDIKDFAGYIRAMVTKSPVDVDSNITKTDNGAIIPKTIASKIIDRVKDLSPLYRDATMYNVRGTLSIPVVDSAKDGITMAYADEFAGLTGKSTTFKSVDLTGYLAGTLTLISRSLINSNDIDLTNFVVNKMAMAVATFYDNELINGTPGKIEGLSKAEQVLTSGAATAVTADELIKLKNTLKSAYQGGAYFVMAPDTFTAVQQLKDKNERYLLNDNIVDGFSGNILGKPVYTSDQMPAMAGGKNAIIYINPAEALGVKSVEDSIEVLTEKYADQHAVGIINWVEMDAKIQNQQAVAILRMKTA